MEEFSIAKHSNIQLRKWNTCFLTNIEHFNALCGLIGTKDIHEFGMRKNNKIKYIL